ncbi:hypothetical protein BCR43DRAFT_448212 [Syncephalastrum racemosum]|uniref:YMC020W-like alpha/beta hydrolase domain-containing protein n=1 Tax=Syncephalastrum racemosum TaxID=13706 RepID=A0A1X2GZD9_SYNRA|nr:hypothetical protein BCR43DRAFT_448212 [Syncephalastrum racemosum]
MKARPDQLVQKRIVVIGVHGWFPTKLVRSVIGEPTGTSKKFCHQMVAAVKHYFATEHHLTLPESILTMIPLEGEGKVEERVSKHYHQLLANIEWLEAISSADVILWATHSQGTPVSFLLLKQLLDLGHIHAHRQPICVLAMAGIGHGPFPVLKGSLIVKYFEADAARELFEFMDSTTRIAQAFHQALADVLRQGIKTVLVGSLQDQVVPLYSATLTAISHPNILRAVYIDKHNYVENDFLIHLVVFALRLRNLGLSDHGLLTNVSEVLAGSIYALEGGHSTVYEERDVYMMAVRTLFDTPPIGHWSRLLYDAPACSKEAGASPPSPAPQEASVEVYQAKARINPYGLPWVLRGIYDDPRILSHDTLRGELERLRGLYQKWNPTDNRLRELKFRLEPLQEHAIV